MKLSEASADIEIGAEPKTSQHEITELGIMTDEPASNASSKGSNNSATLDKTTDIEKVLELFSINVLRMQFSSKDINVKGVKVNETGSRTAGSTRS